MNAKKSICPFCKRQMSIIAKYNKPLKGENYFVDESYKRTLTKCMNCGLFANVRQDFPDLYSGRYVDTTYNDKISQTFEKIMALPFENSDNRQRVIRISHFLKSLKLNNDIKILDIGSGLAVFPAAMSEAGFNCIGLDPDSRAVEHARNRGLQIYHTNFLQLQPDEINENFKLLTFNKVLEHVKDPISFLNHAIKFLQPNGYVYVELPDGEAAQFDKINFAREEFFWEHWFAFSMASLCLLCYQSGFHVIEADRLRDPSGKYTLWALAKIINNN